MDVPEELVAVIVILYLVQGADVAVQEPCHVPLVSLPELKERVMVLAPLSVVIVAVIEFMGLPFVSRAVTVIVCNVPCCISSGSIVAPCICGWPAPELTL